MNFRTLALALGSLLALAVFTPAPAHAANILFVADAGNDIEIAAALMADGHTVTIVTMDETFDGRNPTLEASLDEYDAVFWSGSAGAGWMHTGMAISNLTTYVTNGGRLFYTGYDATVGETELVALLGFTTGNDAVGAFPGALSTEPSSLTVGVRDITGMTPSDGSYDKDCERGALPDTVILSDSSGDPTCAQWSIRPLGAGEVAWVSNGTYSGAELSWSSTTSTFNAAVRNFAFAADAASHAPGAPHIEFTGPFSAEEGDEITLTVALTDDEGDTVTWSWDLDGDGVYGESPGLDTVTIAAGTTDGPGLLVFGVEASDGTNTATRPRRVSITNVAPQILSVAPSRTNLGAMLRYRVVVSDPGGALDPLTFHLLSGPPTMTISDDGVVMWTPGDGDITPAGVSDHITVSVDDGDEGTDTQEFDMTVSSDHVPTQPVPQYPANGIVIADQLPRLAATDASDIDADDVITYRFELDTTATFDSADVVSSGPLPETPAFTAWQLEAPLTTGVTYYWRVWANDGEADSEIATTSFFVVPDPSTIPDTGPAPDAGASDAAIVVHPMARGGCAVGGRGSRAPLELIALGVALLACLRKRRARRAS
jgi:hypothetical protein